MMRHVGRRSTFMSLTTDHWTWATRPRNATSPDRTLLQTFFSVLSPRISSSAIYFVGSCSKEESASRSSLSSAAPVDSCFL